MTTRDSLLKPVETKRKDAPEEEIAGSRRFAAPRLPPVSVDKTHAPALTPCPTPLAGRGMATDDAPLRNLWYMAGLAPRP